MRRCSGGWKPYVPRDARKKAKNGSVEWLRDKFREKRISAQRLTSLLDAACVGKCQNGQVTLSALRLCLQKIGVFLSLRQYSTILQGLDLDQDGNVTVEECVDRLCCGITWQVRNDAAADIQAIARGGQARRRAAQIKAAPGAAQDAALVATTAAVEATSAAARAPVHAFGAT